MRMKRSEIAREAADRIGRDADWFCRAALYDSTDTTWDALKLVPQIENWCAARSTAWDAELHLMQYSPKLKMSFRAPARRQALIDLLLEAAAHFEALEKAEEELKNV